MGLPRVYRRSPLGFLPGARRATIRLTSRRRRTYGFLALLAPAAA